MYFSLDIQMDLISGTAVLFFDGNNSFTESPFMRACIKRLKPARIEHVQIERWSLIFHPSDTRVPGIHPNGSD